MKTENEFQGLTPEEKLKAENDLLRMKLTAEFGMTNTESHLNDESENEWLNHIYNFEKSFADAKRVKIYDFIGKPEFRKIGELRKNEVESELDRLIGIMSENNIVLDCICDYENDVIYRFITEELFEEETDDMRIEGMNHCFIYEEFHPNHDYDLRNYTEDFFEIIYEREWNEEFDKYKLNDELILNDKNLKRDFMGNLILEFQKSNEPFKINSINIDEVTFSIDTRQAIVKGNVILKFNDGFNIKDKYEDKFILGFTLDEFGFWVISDINYLPFNTVDTQDFSDSNKIN